MKKIIFRIFVLIRRSIYFMLYLVDRATFRNNYGLIILSYHSISDDGWRFSVKFSEFTKQIEILQANKFKFITLEDVFYFLKKDKNIVGPAAVITFDDGYKDLTDVADYITELKIQPTLFIITDREQADKKELKNNKEFLSRQEILKLREKGWEIGSHSETHRDFYLLNESEIKREIVSSKQILEKELGSEVNYFSFPRGRYSSYIRRQVRDAGYMLGVTMDDGFIYRESDPYTLPRIGVDGSHSAREFRAIFSPSVVRARQLIKKTFLKKFL